MCDFGNLPSTRITGLSAVLGPPKHHRDDDLAHP